MMGRLRALMLGFAIFSTLLGMCPVSAANSPDDNKDVVLQFYDLFNAGNANGLSDVIAAEVVHHNLAPGLAPGFDGFKQQFVAFHSAFPDIETTVVDTIANGDRVATRVFVTGTQKGAFNGVPASGRAVAFEVMDIYRLAGGKIAEVWEVADLLTLMIEIGAIPSPGAPPHVLPSTAPRGSANLAANTAVALRFYDIFNAGTIDVLSQVVDTNIVDHEPGPGQTTGIEGLKQSLVSFRAGFSDLRLTIADVIAEGDKVVVRSSLTGTQSGTFLGMPASGKLITIDAIDINRIANGKIVETWHIEDLVGALSQIGAGPAAGSPPASPAPTSPTPPAAPSQPPTSPGTAPVPFSVDPSSTTPILATGPRFTGPGYAAGRLAP